MVLENKLKACQRAKRSLMEQLRRTEENMLTIIDQYKEKVNQLLVIGKSWRKNMRRYRLCKWKREARERVIESLHGEALRWMDKFALTLNKSEELPRLLAKAKAMANTYSAPDEVHGLFDYCQHMVELMTHILGITEAFVLYLCFGFGKINDVVS